MYGTISREETITIMVATIIMYICWHKQLQARNCGYNILLILLLLDKKLQLVSPRNYGVSQPIWKTIMHTYVHLKLSMAMYIYV